MRGADYPGDNDMSSSEGDEDRRLPALRGKKRKRNERREEANLQDSDASWEGGGDRLEDSDTMSEGGDELRGDIEALADASSEEEGRPAKKRASGARNRQDLHRTVPRVQKSRGTRGHA